MNRRFYFFTSVILMISFFSCSNRQVYLHIEPEKQKALTVVFERTEEGFCLADEGKAAALLVDSNDAEVVRIAAEDFAKDVNLVCGVQPELILTKSGEQSWRDCVVIGTLGSSRLINACIEKGLISAEDIRGKWENFKIEVVRLAEGHRLLVIVGSDRRGTAYGVFELSKMMGVSPWVWWADVVPKKRKSLYIQEGLAIVQRPSVKYRGIFLNDEDWGLKPWASENIDTDIGDIGPKTYEHIFELMLRMKANFIWPAMHECTKAFFYYRDNPKVAEKYAIVLGSSHCEPMLRNNVDEWSHNFRSEYGERPGRWRYDTNKEQIYRYWQDRARESVNIDCIYTVGMRAIHDSSMPGPPSVEGKIKLLEEIFSDQRKILSEARGKPASEIPQAFCPYKEVLDLYKNGLEVPEDVTIVWPDDNHGYIRKLPNPDEQKRPGGHGVYYHISYHGGPHSYLWLSTISPALVSFELSRAYAFGTDDIWVINVGDIKPAEMETEFCMDLAWDVSAWGPENAHSYVRQWAARTFGAEFADDFASIKNEFYRLAHRAKPEHIYLSGAQITMDLAERRVGEYRKLAEQAEELEKRIPDELKDAYFQLLLYPVVCAGKTEEKIFYARKSLELAEKGDQAALGYSQKAGKAHEEIRELTRVYNKQIAGGKWDGMMIRDSYPDAGWLRGLAEGQPLIYEMPRVADSNMIKNAKGEVDLFEQEKAITTIPAESFVNKKDDTNTVVKIIEGLGISGASVVTMPFTSPPIAADEITDAPYVEYEAQLAKGQRTVEVKCVPTFGVYEGRGVRYAVSVNGDRPQVRDISAADNERDSDWARGVLRGYASSKTSHTVDKDGKSRIQIYLLDVSLAVSEIEIK